MPCRHWPLTGLGGPAQRPLFVATARVFLRAATGSGERKTQTTHHINKPARIFIAPELYRTHRSTQSIIINLFLQLLSLFSHYLAKNNYTKRDYVPLPHHLLHLFALQLPARAPRPLLQILPKRQTPSQRTHRAHRGVEEVQFLRGRTKKKRKGAGCEARAHAEREMCEGEDRTEGARVVEVYCGENCGEGEEMSRRGGCCPFYSSR